MSNNRELMEWLGITPADLLIYLAITAIAAMFFVHDSTIDIVLATVGVALTLAACPLGMGRDPEVSNFTNVVKRVSYPICVVIVLAVIAVHYVWFNK